MKRKFSPVEFSSIGSFLCLPSSLTSASNCFSSRKSGKFEARSRWKKPLEESSNEDYDSGIIIVDKWNSIIVAMIGSSGIYRKLQKSTQFHGTPGYKRTYLTTPSGHVPLVGATLTVIIPKWKEQSRSVILAVWSVIAGYTTHLLTIVVASSTM